MITESEISCVAIVGAGTIGSRIAFRCITFGKDVYLFDRSDAAIQRALNENRSWLENSVSEGVLTVSKAQSALDRLTMSSSLPECLLNAQLVIEAVSEDIHLKRQVFAEIDCLSPDPVLISTSSSSIPCSRLAAATGRPDRVINIHFPHPRDGAPTEIMGGPDTAVRTVAAAEGFVKSLGMLPIIVKREVMGFGLNTIWHEIKKTALKLVAGGYLHFEDIDRAWIASKHGTLGIFADLDLIGLDVVRDIEMLYYTENGDERDRPPRFLDEMVARGHLGEKSGQGFYTYPNPEYEFQGWLEKEPPWTPEMARELHIQE